MFSVERTLELGFGDLSLSLAYPLTGVSLNPLDLSQLIFKLKGSCSKGPFQFYNSIIKYVTNSYIFLKIK